MNVQILLWATLLFSVTLASCSDDHEALINSHSNLQVSTSFQSTTRSLIGTNGLGANEKIGISLYHPDGSNYENKTNGYENILYESKENGLGIVWSSLSPIVLSGREGKAIAYYPYSKFVTTPKSIPIETDSQTDYLYSDWVTGLSSMNAKGQFIMNHALCAIKVNFTNQSYTQGIGYVSSISVESAELATNAILNAYTGSFTSITGKGTPFLNNRGFTLADRTNCTFLAIPTGEQSTLTIHVKLDNKTYTIPIKMSKPYEKGTIYNVNLAVKNSVTTLEVTNVQIKPWVQQNLGDFNFQ